MRTSPYELQVSRRERRSYFEEAFLRLAPDDLSINRASVDQAPLRCDFSGCLQSKLYVERMLDRLHGLVINISFVLAKTAFINGSNLFGQRETGAS